MIRAPGTCSGWQTSGGGASPVQRNVDAAMGVQQAPRFANPPRTLRGSSPCILTKVIN